MSHAFCNASGRIAPVALTLALTLVAAAPARAQTMNILGVTPEAVTGELLIGGDDTDVTTVVYDMLLDHRLSTLAACSFRGTVVKGS